jgi:hypothetical protein
MRKEAVQAREKSHVDFLTHFVGQWTSKDESGMGISSVESVGGTGVV